eukprot:CAMPEP_0196141536 /NCGR_PEP_ID=MMETSP0910-20130528/9942_1 /TAXON_ID=49265 /ORGANISM="Thalassiosira rotula, Strain GSO102" /LENGTH=387 /DNA_ID=CAMNT_0041402701 /DNA_START=254 /DNA_END=1417 /DNA_ORIENTATION=-
MTTKQIAATTPKTSTFTLAAITSATLTVLTGVTQPLLITVAKEYGLTDPRAQLYMLFYYIGPASISLSIRSRCFSHRSGGDDDGSGNDEEKSTLINSTASSDDTTTLSENEWPSGYSLLKAAGIAAIDIFAQSMNYTGVSMAGPTIFAIIYSSVTIWTAVYSRVLLHRKLTPYQWSGVGIVFGGLTLTCLHSLQLGPKVFLGSCLIFVGSSIHALVYVISEYIMTRGKFRITVRANCAIQGLVACIALLLWQIVYTRPRYSELIRQPMMEAGTSWSKALVVFLGIALANFIHSISFFYTLRHFPGGAVSAGVLKGLQAVLVFAATSFAFCGHVGGEEMCFNGAKLLSLVVVVGGSMVYGKATEVQSKKEVASDGYRSVPDAVIENKD